MTLRIPQRSVTPSTPFLEAHLGGIRNLLFSLCCLCRLEWMRANRRQSLAELCNPKLVRLAQVPHRTADREDPKLARRKWQPPHNMGEPQMENTLDNTFKHRNCTNGQILRSGSKLIEAGDYTSI